MPFCEAIKRGKCSLSKTSWSDPYCPVLGGGRCLWVSDLSPRDGHYCQVLWSREFFHLISLLCFFPFFVLLWRQSRIRVRFASEEHAASPVEACFDKLLKRLKRSLL